MSDDRDEIYLGCILDSVHLVSVHLSMLGEGQVWYRHPTVREAILRAMHIMAESCQKLSAETKAMMPEVDWRRVSNFRNVLVHDYAGGIDFTLVGKVMDAPMLQLQEVAARAYKVKYRKDYIVMQEN